MPDRTDHAAEAVRALSTKALSKKYRLEIAAGVHRLGRERIHASMVADVLDHVPLAKVADELGNFVEMGFLRRVDDPAAKNTMYEVCVTVFFEFVAKLEDEVRGRL
jgi:hypothetical protein